MLVPITRRRFGGYRLVLLAGSSVRFLPFIKQVRCITVLACVFPRLDLCAGPDSDIRTSLLSAFFFLSRRFPLSRTALVSAPFPRWVTSFRRDALRPLLVPAHFCPLSTFLPGNWSMPQYQPQVGEYTRSGDTLENPEPNSARLQSDRANRR